MYDELDRYLDDFCDRDDHPWHWAAPHPYGGSDDRLRVLVHVDGRLVDSWTGSVRGTRWNEFADRFDAERRPAPVPRPAVPPHVQVLRWLDGVVGGRPALLALDVRPTADVTRPEIIDPAAEAAYSSILEHLDRVSTDFFGEEAARVLRVALRALWEADPAQVTTRPPTQVAGGLVWVVGRANDLFRGGLTQTTVQRELWLKSGLSQCGRGIGNALRGVDLHDAVRPRQCPDLIGFGNPDLLTSRTRRTLVQWRDQARAADAVQILPPEVDS